MKLVNEALAKEVSDYKILGPVEADPEYKLVRFYFHIFF